MTVLLACLLSVPLLGGCFQDSTPQRSDFVPFDYRVSFPEVRGCRLVADHGLAYERVLASPATAVPYTAGNYPLPEGSVVVGEQHLEASCTSLSGVYVMAKEKPGYDPAHADWRWHRLDANQRVLEDGRLGACSSCHAKPPCSDYLCSPP